MPGCRKCLGLRDYGLSTIYARHITFDLRLRQTDLEVTHHSGSQLLRIDSPTAIAANCMFLSEKGQCFEFHTLALALALALPFLPPPLVACCLCCYIMEIWNLKLISCDTYVSILSNSTRRASLLFFFAGDFDLPRELIRAMAFDLKKQKQKKGGCALDIPGEEVQSTSISHTGPASVTPAFSSSQARPSRQRPLPLAPLVVGVRAAATGQLALSFL